jgi:hypothetical protein
MFCESKTMNITLMANFIKKALLIRALGCPTRIRTWTGRTKICSATVTLSDNLSFWKIQGAKLKKNSLDKSL